jgi:hypothetical protein
MATYYWVGGNGTWDSSTTTNWSLTSGGAGGAGVPTATDNAVFNSASSGATYVVTVGTNAVAADIDITGPSSGFLDLTMGATAVINCHGSWSHPTNRFAFTSSAGATINFLASTSKTINASSLASDFGGVNLTFNNASGTWTLGFQVITTGNVTLTAGALDANFRNITSNSFSSSNSNVRSLSRPGAMVLTGNNATLWNTSNATNLTYGSIPTVSSTYSGSVGTRVFATAGSSDRISLSITNGTDIVAPTSTFTVDNYTFNNGAGFRGTLTNVPTNIFGDLYISSLMTLSAGSNTFTFKSAGAINTISSAGKTFDFPIVFDAVGGRWQLAQALTVGSTRTTTLTNGELNLNSFTLTTGIFSANNSNVRSLLFGTGSIVLTGNAATIWSVSTLTNFSYTGTPTVDATYSGSSGTRTLAHGTAITGTEADALNFNISAGSDTVTLATDFFGRIINFTGFSGVLTANTRTVYGDFTLSPTMTLSGGTETTTFAAPSGTQLVTSNGKTIDNPVIIDAVSADVVMQDALTLGSTRALTLINGKLKLKAGVTSTVGSIATSGGNVKFLESTTSGVQATISDAAGTNSVSNLYIQDSNATGGASFLALTSNGCVDSGNNTGWIFKADSGNFFMFF